jgi:CHAT domain-containing protein
VDGQGSALSLPAGGELTPGDILALPHVPRFVALFGCETGMESTGGEMGALGLAHAFLAAGARSVVASSRVVDDALARDTARAFYASLVAGADLDPTRALRDAQLVVRARAAAADWAAFRALVP